MRRNFFLIWGLLLAGEAAFAQSERGDGGDPLHLIFESARSTARLMVLGLEYDYLPENLEGRSRQFLERLLSRSQEPSLLEFANDIKDSPHKWDANPYPQSTCARTNVEAPMNTIHLKLELCERRVDLGGGPIAAVKVLIHEATHHFGITGSAEDENAAWQIANAIVAAYERKLGEPAVNWQFSPAAADRRIARRAHHTGVWTGADVATAVANRLVVWGGCHGHQDVAPQHGCGEWLADGGFYDPLTNSWEKISTDDAPSARARHTAVWTGVTGNPDSEAQMLVWGGCTRGERRACHVALDTGGRYSAETRSWQPISENDAPTARALHTAVWTGSEMIVWGGVENYKHLTRPEVAVASGGRYDPAHNTWARTSVEDHTPTPRRDHSAIWTGEKMVIFGGCDRVVTDYACINYFDDGAMYNPQTDTWRKLAQSNAPSPRRHHAAVYLPELHAMLIFGGEHAARKLRDGALYRFDTDEWHEINYGGPSPRSGHLAVWSGHEVLVFGGEGSIGEFPSEPWLYRPGSDQWQRLEPRDTLEGRRDHVVVWTGTQLVTFGGYSERETIQWTGGTLQIRRLP